MKSVTALLLAVSLLCSALSAQNRDPVALANAAVPPGAQRIAYGTERAADAVDPAT